MRQPACSTLTSSLTCTQALAGIMAPHFGPISAAGFQCVSLLARSGGGGGADVPVRMGWTWDVSAQSFKSDRFLGQVCVGGSRGVNVKKVGVVLIGGQGVRVAVGVWGWVLLNGSLVCLHAECYALVRRFEPDHIWGQVH